MSLLERYQKEIIPSLMREFGLKNALAAPRVVKVVVNVGLGKAEKKVFDQVAGELALILGQKPKVCRARKSVAGFDLRAGKAIGLSATLRGKKMYDFLEKLFVIVLPQVKDFRGLSLKSFDGQGNYSLGFSEHVVFPEIGLAKTSAFWGLEVTIITNTKDNGKAKRLLELLGAPFAPLSGGPKGKSGKGSKDG